MLTNFAKHCKIQVFDFTKQHVLSKRILEQNYKTIKNIWDLVIRTRQIFRKLKPLLFESRFLFSGVDICNNSDLSRTPISVVSWRQATEKVTEPCFAWPTQWRWDLLSTRYLSKSGRLDNLSSWASLRCSGASDLPKSSTIWHSSSVAEVCFRRFSSHFLLLSAERAWTAAQPERRREAPERRLPATLAPRRATENGSSNVGS